MTEFYEVNTNAKSVPTDLAWELLRQRAEEDPEFAAMLEDCERSPKTTARDHRKRQHVGWLSVCLVVVVPVRFQSLGLVG
jgi:hypothetical protein